MNARLRTAPVSRAAVTRELDRRLIEDAGLPSIALMESAARGAADAVHGWFGPRRAVVLCGPGNNGGDGYAIARRLAGLGWSVACRPLLPPASPDCRAMAAVARALGLVAEGGAGASAIDPRWLEGADVVIDAVLGTGQRPGLDIGGDAGGRPVVAVDVPTGIDADTGARVGAFPAATHVVTIGRRKPFLYTLGAAWACVDIGLEAVAREAPEAVEVLEATVESWPSSANKWDRGHVGVLAGSAEMAGAGVLACVGALRGGAGLVTLFLERPAWGRLAELPPEVMVAEPGDYRRADVLLVGPGLGRARDAEVRALWESWARPLVLDADGLRALGRGAVAAAGPRVLTPHAGEAAALLGDDGRALERDRLATAARIGAMGVAIYKGASPIVAGGSGPMRIVEGFAPALGTGGSGDVLGGVVAALCHRLGDAFDAATLACAAHVRAGRGLPVGATAREIADGIARALADGQPESRQ